MMCASQCVLWNIMYAQLWLNELMCMKAAWVFFSHQHKDQILNLLRTRVSHSNLVWSSHTVLWKSPFLNICHTRLVTLDKDQLSKYKMHFLKRLSPPTYYLWITTFCVKLNSILPDDCQTCSRRDNQEIAVWRAI